MAGQPPAHPGTWRGAAGNFGGSIRGRPAPGRTRGSTLLLPVPDADLLARLRAGDHGAFDACFREWYPAAVRAGTRLLRDEGVAEELAQALPGVDVRTVGDANGLGLIRGATADAATLVASL